MRETRRQRAASGIGRALVAGGAGGLAMGAGMRFAMRMAAVTEGQETTFTIGGTLFLLLAGAGFGLLMGMLYWGVRRWLPGPGWWRGLTFGLLLAVLGGLLLFGDPDSEARDIGSVWVNALTFGGSFVLLGIVAEWTWDRLEDRADPIRRAASGGVAGSVAGAAAGALITGIALARWVGLPPDGFWTVLGTVALFAFLGLLLGGVFGVVYGLLRRSGGRRARIVYPLVIVALWLLLVFTVGEEGPTGSPHAAEIVMLVGVLLAGFGVVAARLTDSLVGRLATSVSVAPAHRIGG